jgi:hypothetical protein
MKLLLKYNFFKVMLVLIILLIVAISGIVFINQTKILKPLLFTEIKPKEMITLKGNPKSDQLEFHSTLTIESKENVKLKLTGTGSNYSVKPYWDDLETDILYNVKKKVGIHYITEGDHLEKMIIPNDKKSDVYIENDGIIIKFKGKKTFNIKDAKPFEIKIENVSNDSTKIYAYITEY